METPPFRPHCRYFKFFYLLTKELYNIVKYISYINCWFSIFFRPSLLLEKIKNTALCRNASSGRMKNKSLYYLYKFDRFRLRIVSWRYTVFSLLNIIFMFLLILIVNTEILIVLHKIKSEYLCMAKTFFTFKILVNNLIIH